MKKFDITPLLPFYDKAADLCRDAFRREEEVAPLGLLEEFRAGMEAVLGEGSCHVLSIRPEGGILLEEVEA